MTDKEKQLRKVVSDSWSNALAYLGAIGISGTLVAEVSNGLQRLTDTDARPESRVAAGNEVAKVVEGLTLAAEALDAITNAGHDIGKRAGQELRKMNGAIGELQAAIDASAVVPVVCLCPTIPWPNREEEKNHA